MRAIIPVAGIGSRLRPHTHTQPKSLIPVAGKPILAHIIAPLREAGITDFVFITGYLGDKIQDYISKHFPDIQARYIIQTTGKGIGYALWLTREYLDTGEEVTIVLGDTIADINYGEIMKRPGNYLGCKRVDNPSSFGVAEIDSQGKVIKLSEKPAIPKSNLALVGVYKISDTLQLSESLEYIVQNNIRTQNEFHLTDALMYMVNHGHDFHTFEVDNWFDCGNPEILLQTNAILLKRASGEVQNYPGSIIISPVYIGPGVKIKSSIIGPDVSIGDDAIIDSSIIRDTIIGPGAHLTDAILNHSLIGNDATFTGMKQSLNIGDSAEINFK